MHRKWNKVNQDENSSTFYIKKRGIGSFCAHNDNIFMHIFLKKGQHHCWVASLFLFGSRVFLVYFSEENKKISRQLIYSNISYLTHFILNVLHHIYTMHTTHTHKMAQMDPLLLDVRVYFIYTTYFILISKVSSEMYVRVCEFFCCKLYTD